MQSLRANRWQRPFGLVPNREYRLPRPRRHRPAAEKSCLRPCVPNECFHLESADALPFPSLAPGTWKCPLPFGCIAFSLLSNQPETSPRSSVTPRALRLLGVVTTAGCRCLFFHAFATRQN